MARLSLVLSALLLCAATTHGATSPLLGDDWYPVGSRFTGPMPPPEVVELKHGALTWNKVAISEAQIAEYVHRVIQLEPRPRVYLYFSSGDYPEAQRLAAQIRGAGGCDGGGCLFKVTGH